MTLPITRARFAPLLLALTAAAAAPALAEAPPQKAQAPGWCRMTLGAFEVTARSDGTVKLPSTRCSRASSPIA